MASATGSVTVEASGTARARFSLAHVGVGLVALAALSLAQATRMIGSVWLSDAEAARAWEEARSPRAGEGPLAAGADKPVARLLVPSLGIDEVVRAGGEEDLDGGPRLLAETAEGAISIAGHRDTHFRFLRALRPGAEIFLERPDGRRSRFAVLRSEVLNPNPGEPARKGASAEPGLTLLTHYPLDAVPPGGPLRFAVHAVPAEEG